MVRLWPRRQPQPPRGRGAVCFGEVGLPDGYEPPSAALRAEPAAGWQAAGGYPPWVGPIARLFLPPRDGLMEKAGDPVTVTLYGKRGVVIHRITLRPGDDHWSFDWARPEKVKRIEITRK